MQQILWGLFKKIVIADNCAEYVNLIFNNSGDYSGSTLILGAIFFSIQIYGDFSGYSDIAIGVSRLFGFNLMQNFNFPYFSRDIPEFWRRWHISLSTWFRDYVYIPLGGSKVSMSLKIRNLFIIFLVSGFWHGANWTFIIWGALNAVYFLPLFLTKNHRKYLGVVAKGKYLPTLKELTLVLSTYSLTTFAWIFFRAENLTHALHYISEIFSPSIFSLPEIFPLSTLILIIIFILMEWIGRKNQYAIESYRYQLKKPFRFAIYYTIIFAIFWFQGEEQQFIYFQF